MAILNIDTQLVANALKSDATSCRIMEKDLFPKSGDKVGVRLNLNVLKNTGVAVQTIHAASNKAGYKNNQGFYSGEAIGYAGAVELKDAYFNVHQGARESIAMGLEAKSPMASVDGTFMGCPIPSMCPKQRRPSDSIPKICTCLWMRNAEPSAMRNTLSW